MNRPTFHICIATGQNLPNLIPALQLSARRVAILETPAMKTSAQNLKTALAAHGIEIERHAFDDSTPERIRASAAAIATKLGEQPLIFNATGGHKLMTLALSEEMRIADELHLLYCETRHDRLDWLSPDAVTEPLDNLLKVEDFLLTQGYRITSRGERDGYWANDAQQRETLTRKLGDEADKLARFFGTLNRLADQCLKNEPDSPYQFEQELEFAPGGRNADVLELAQKHGVLSWDGDTRLVFKGETAARYFRGGWLEEYAWIKLRGLRPHDWSVNLTSQTLNQTPNEYDALVAHRNRLLLIECKTTRFGRDGLKDASYVYKLAQLAQQTGGSMSSSLLLSARPVSEDVRQRARDSRVDILAAEEVRTLPDYLRQWMQGQ
jgi:Domain of unknown function (DUF1887).